MVISTTEKCYTSVEDITADGVNLMKATPLNETYKEIDSKYM